MIELFIGLLLFILILISIKYNIRKFTQIAIVLINVLLIAEFAGSYLFYNKHNLSMWDYWQYKHQALDYSKVHDPSQIYKVANIEKQGCKLLQGCLVFVNLESTTSQDMMDVMFHNGKIIQSARPMDEKR
ncbi:hypothetical protein [Paenibacillus hexagrammi]|uniref:Uncharacterized protein n=1 Tax=Paenibacillus hexagrammi TaxID=2908839 RepID=A0ABY3SDK7_9BACL|nr:hypothetical protein [Paenibacillus sp. YPD9-1]UJF31236.1 hypothetical protein L0M14_15265 [Paenibacillus sp. YPD9-1]